MIKFSLQDAFSVAQQLPESIKQSKLSIIMPCYNEEDLIEQSIEHVIQTLNSWQWNFELIVINDGSKDNSFSKISALSSKFPQLQAFDNVQNFGKGRALISGFELSTGEYILFLDSDLELPVEHLPFFIKKMIDEQADVVVGSKSHPQSNITYPLFRKIFSTCYFWLSKLLFRLPISDTQTGIKLFKRNTLENTMPYLIVKRFAFDIELLTLIHHQAYHIVEHPIILEFVRPNVLGRISLDTILHMFKDTLAIFFRLITSFWKGQKFSRDNNISIAIVSPNKSYTHNDLPVFHVQNLQELMQSIKQLQKYDLIVFLQSIDDIPVFIKFTLQRIFKDPNIQAVYPLLYPQKEQGQGFLKYSLLANLFYAQGYYPRYRPAKQRFLDKDFKGELMIPQTIIRSQYLNELLQKEQYQIQDLSKVFYSPYVFLLRDFENPDSFIVTEPCSGEKKYAKIFTWTLRIIVLITAFYFPKILWLLVILELSIWTWSIFSLGIRRGIKFIKYFVWYRLF